MNPEDLVRMANQIADFFAPYPRDEAVVSTAGHIKSFWEPRMRTALAEHLVAGGEGLNEIALEAARALSAEAAAS